MLQCNIPPVGRVHNIHSLQTVRMTGEHQTYDHLMPSYYDLPVIILPPASASKVLESGLHV